MKSFQERSGRLYQENTDDLGDPTTSESSTANVFRIANTQEELATLDTMMLLSQPSTSTDQTEPFLQGVRTSFKQLRDKKSADERRIIELDEEIKSLRERHDVNQQTLLDLQMQEEKLSEQHEAEKENLEMMNVKMQDYQQIVKTINAYCVNLTEAKNQMDCMKEDLVGSKNELISGFKKMKINAEDAKEECEKKQAVMLAILETREKRKCLAIAFSKRKKEILDKHNSEMSELNAKLLQNQTTIKSLESEHSSIKRNIDVVKQKQVEMAKKDDEEIEILKEEIDKFNKKYVMLQKTQEEDTQRKDEALARKSKRTLELEMMDQRAVHLQADQAACVTTVESLRVKMDEATAGYEQTYEELNKILSKNSQMETELGNMRKLLEETRNFNLQRISELKDSLGIAKANAADEVDKLNKEIDSLTTNSSANMVKCDQLRNELSSRKCKLLEEKELYDSAVSLNYDLEKQQSARKDEKEKLLSTLECLTNLLDSETDKVRIKDAELCKHKELAEMELKLCLESANEKKNQVLAIKETISAKNENVSALLQKLEQLKSDSEIKRKSTSNECSTAIREANERILTLEKKLQKVREDNHKVAESHRVKVEQLEKNLAAKENDVTKAQSDQNKASKSIENRKKGLISLESEIKELGRSEEEIIVSLSKHKESVSVSKGKVNALSAVVKKKEKELLAKEKKMCQLKQQVECLEKAVTDGAAKNIEEKMMLHHNLVNSKQTKESLSITSKQLYSELEELKKIQNTAQTELESITRNRDEIQEEMSKSISDNEKIKSELEGIVQSLMNTESQSKKANSELRAANQEYNKLCNKISKAKAKSRKKQTTDSANVKVSEVKGDKGKVKDASTASTSKNDTTPRSILKPSSKPSTPQSAKKNVSFSQTTEDINSSASTVVME